YETVSWAGKSVYEQVYDVTETSIPLDPKTHALDVVLVGVNGDGFFPMLPKPVFHWILKHML
ncbi:hypothetical protein, partial [Sphingobacterium daejeonense]|uniref:hypothetical protein n=1 Tax=Sphingobacterium daejeonense TaxID=371142 RepID=UPI003D31B6F0